MGNNDIVYTPLTTN